MRLFLDAANVHEIRQAATMGVVSGVTTNHSPAPKEYTGTSTGHRDAVLE